MKATVVDFGAAVADILLAWHPWDRRLKTIKEFGWTWTKASYLRALTWPELPDFPLHAEVACEVPRNLPGAMPRSVTALLKASAPSH